MNFYSIFWRNSSKQTEQPEMGLYCLSISHKKDARLINVKRCINSNGPLA